MKKSFLGAAGSEERLLSDSGGVEAVCGGVGVVGCRQVRPELTWTAVTF